MRTILLATDGSDSSDEALAFAIDLAQGVGASLEIISVRTARAPDDADRIVTEAALSATAAGVEGRTHAAHGDVVGRIVAAASELSADMLVVGARGLGPASGATLGSVSQALVRRSPVPVTVVRRTGVRVP